MPLVHLSVGEEAIAVGVCAHRTDKDDITSTHRGHGHGHGIAKLLQTGRVRKAEGGSALLPPSASRLRLPDDSGR